MLIQAGKQKRRKKFMEYNLLMLLILLIAQSDFNFEGVNNNSSATSIKDSIETISRSQFEYLGDGKIKMGNFPAWPRKNHTQGIFYLKDINDSVIMDMNLPNEVIPHGANSVQSIGGWFPFEDISMPADYNAINPWGQIFIQNHKEYPEAALIHIKNLTLACYRNSTQSWEILSDPDTIDGIYFIEDFSKPDMKNADITRLKNEIVVKIDETTKGMCFHFWTSLIYIDDPSDIKYLTVYCDCWEEGNNTDNCFAINVGADYKKMKRDIIQNIHECIGGRFIEVRKTKRRVYATNIDYNDYFKYSTYANFIF